MPRKTRPIVAENLETGEKTAYESVYACAKALRLNVPSVLAAADKNGVCRGYRIYDTPETIKERIKELQKMLENYGKDEF